MVHQMLGSLVKRGVEMHDTFRKSGGPQHGHKEPKTPEDVIEKLPGGLLASLFVTFFVFVVVLSLTEYTYGRLIPTLTMVETPSSVLVESTTHNDIVLDSTPEAPTKGSSAPPAYSAVPSDEPTSERREAILVTSTPVTASLRTTLQHLRGIGGFRSRYRGFWMFFFYSLLLQQFTMLFASFGGFIIGGIIAAALMAVPRMTWVHIVISSPLPKPWYRRFPSKADFGTAVKKVTGLTVLVAVAEVGGAAVFMALMPQMKGMQDPDMNKHHQPTSDDEKDELRLRVCMMQTAIAGLAWLAWSAFFTIPLTACLAKIQTSLLPEDEDTVVNVERTEDMTLAEAWRSFDWNARVRVYKAYAKFVAIQTAIIFAFGIGIYFMFCAFLGWNWEETINQRLFATFYAPRG